MQLIAKEKELFWAVIDRNYDKVIQLLALPTTNLNDVCFFATQSDGDHPSDGWTPIYFAIRNQDLKMVELLIKGGADLVHISGQKQTPLSYAAFLGSVEIIELLLKEGAPVEYKEISALSIARRYKQKGAIRVLQRTEKK